MLSDAQISGIIRYNTSYNRQFVTEFDKQWCKAIKDLRKAYNAKCKKETGRCKK